MIDQLMRTVKEFHDKHGFAVCAPMKTDKESELWSAGSAVGSVAISFEASDEHDDLRFARAHLMCEELGELLTAMSEGDRVGVLDGLADLLYVVIGTAVTFDLPLMAAFAEVHRSNMTKAVTQDDKRWHPDKIGDYSPPDLEGVLERHNQLRITGQPTWDTDPMRSQTLHLDS